MHLRGATSYVYPTLNDAMNCSLGVYCPSQKPLLLVLQSLNVVIPIFLTCEEEHACIPICMTSKAAKTDAGLLAYLVSVNAHMHLDCCTEHIAWKDVPAMQ